MDNPSVAELQPGKGSFPLSNAIREGLLEGLTEQSLLLVTEPYCSQRILNDQTY